MKITEAVTRAIQQNAESDWQLIYYLNNSPVHSGFVFDKHSIVEPEYSDSSVMVTCHDVGAREGLIYHNLMEV